MKVNWIPKTDYFLRWARSRVYLQLVDVCGCYQHETHRDSFHSKVIASYLIVLSPRRDDFTRETQATALRKIFMHSNCLLNTTRWIDCLLLNLLIIPQVCVINLRLPQTELHSINSRIRLITRWWDAICWTFLKFLSSEKNDFSWFLSLLVIILLKGRLCRFFRFNGY